MICNKNGKDSLMPYSRRVFNLMLCCAATLLLNHQTLHSQTLTNSQSTTTEKSHTKDVRFAESFWDYLLANNYKHWSPPPGKPAGHFSGQNSSTNMGGPHGSLSKLYVNRTAASNPNEMPVGSVLILENYRPDKSLYTISVMYRTAGFNPSGNDWFWINYNADGTVSKDQMPNANSNGNSQHMLVSARSAVKLAGRATSCIQCHQGGGKDLVFFNSRKRPASRTATNQNPTLQSGQNQTIKR